MFICGCWVCCCKFRFGLFSLLVFGLWFVEALVRFVGFMAVIGLVVLVCCVIVGWGTGVCFFVVVLFGECMCWLMLICYCGFMGCGWCYGELCVWLWLEIVCCGMIVVV